MKKRAILFLLLSGLLVACAPAASTTLSTAAPSPTTLANPSQAPSRAIPPSPHPASTPTSSPSPTTAPILPPENLPILERTAQLGGSISGIIVVGDVAYVGLGPRLAAFDISGHEHPQLVEQSEPLPGLVTQLLQVTGGPAPFLLVNAGRFLVLIDISGPGIMDPIRQLELPGAITAMAWDARAGILYAGGSIYQGSHPHSTYTGYISAIEFSPDSNLKLLDTATLPEWPLSLALGKESLFAGAQGYQGGLYHLEVKTPGELSTPNLVIASTPESPLQPLHMQVIGERLYLSFREVAAYDITDPGQPKQIWANNVGSSVVKDFQMAGEQIYIYGWTIRSEYVRYAVTPPEPIVGSPIGDTASVTALHNGDYLIAYRDLEIYDTANPQGLALLGKYRSPLANAVAAVANEKAVFVVDLGMKDGSGMPVLQALSLPDLEPLGQLVVDLPTNVGNARFPWIALDGDRLYLASANSIWVFDVANLQPFFLGNVDIAGGKIINAIAAFTQGEQRLLVISQEVEYLVNNLLLYDLTDLQAPAGPGNTLPLDKGSFLQMTREGSAVYMVIEDNLGCHCVRMDAVDIQDSHLALRDSLQLPQYFKYLAADYDFVGVVSTNGLSLISAAGSEPLELLTQLTLPEQGKGIAIKDDRIWVVVGDDYGAAQLLAFNILNPTNPRQAAAFDLSISENDIVPILLVKFYVILVNGAGGVEVLSVR